MPAVNRSVPSDETANITYSCSVTEGTIAWYVNNTLYDVVSFSESTKPSDTGKSIHNLHVAPHAIPCGRTEITCSAGCGNSSVYLTKECPPTGMVIAHV